MSDGVWREIHLGRVWRAHACRIVIDSPDLIALWFPVGTTSQRPNDDQGNVLRIPRPEWTLVPDLWRRSGVSLTRPGRAHSIWLFSDVDSWYVNFERPLRRTAIGFDTFDEKLDLIVEPDGSYRWKDEDELEQAAAVGLLDADAVRAAAALVLEEWPFPTGWEDWKPDPSWPIPRLPEGWDVV